MAMKLYNAARSSASVRVRIALHFKGLPFEYVAIDLRRGDQSTDDYRAINPAELVPTLEHDGLRLTQSMAIIEYLDEKYPSPPLLPHEAEDRAWVRAFALAIACDIHPLNNLRVLRYLLRPLGVSEDAKNAWYRHWVETGLGQLERHVVASNRSGRYAFGDHVTLADVFLVPQILNAQRYECRLDHVPTLMKIFDACMQHPAFAAAAPEKQPDFVA